MRKLQKFPIDNTDERSPSVVSVLVSKTDDPNPYLFRSFLRNPVELLTNSIIIFISYKSYRFYSRICRFALDK